MKKQNLFLIFVLIVICFYIFILYVPKNYEIDYIINKVKINEKYNKSEKQYEFIFSYQNREYPLIVDGKYEIKQKHINSVDLVQGGSDTCLNITYKDVIYYVCSDDNGLKDYRLIDSDLYDEFYPKVDESRLIEVYDSIEIYDKSNIYLIWNYNGYINISDNNSKVKLFEKEKYTSTNSYQVNNYLIVPDYDSEYYFKKLYVYDIFTCKYKTFSFDYEISYNLLYMGIYKNKVYFLDLKNSNEFVIDLKNFTLKLINELDNNGLYYNGEKLVSVKVDSLVKNEEVFPKNINKYNYIIDNDKLYQVINGYKIMVSNRKITSIVGQVNDTVYYLVEDTIYSFNYNHGERIVLRNKEWLFNYKNQVFVFNKNV